MSLSPYWDRLIVLANRAPYRHELASDGRVTLTRTASGLVTALEPLVDACSGTWVAHAAGSADTHVTDMSGGLAVPPATPRYRLRYVPVDADEHRGFYYGFANEALWPLCHAVPVPAVFRSSDFRHYERANARFAAAVAHEAAGPAPLVLVQDYHFALAPRLLRRLLPSSTIVHFWHIPWPNYQTLRTCPWHRELLDGILGSDLIGFQTAEDAANFVESVHVLLRVEMTGQRRVTYRRHTTRLGVYPVGVEWDNAIVRATPPRPACREQVLREFDICDPVRLVVGIDRLDYTKGLAEKFLAAERALERYPALRGRLAFVQVAEPSRECLPAYRDARARMRDIVGQINSRYGTTSSTPVRFLEMHHDAADVYRLYRAADVCYVGSLHDGMNLVAKEFVCARTDGEGVLVLSEFAGAARQLRTALRINPFDIDGSAAALADACAMSEAEQAARMRVMRANVRAFDAGWWATSLLADARAVRRGAARPASVARFRSGPRPEVAPDPLLAV